MNGKIDWVRKLTSRKFWLSVANFVGMLVVALGGTDNQATQVTALIIAGATVLAYIIGEGLVDAANKDACYPLAEIMPDYEESYYNDCEEAEDEEEDAAE